MNHQYRIVFNRTLGLWQVASELAKTCGKATRSARSITSKISVNCNHHFSSLADTFFTRVSTRALKSRGITLTAVALGLALTGSAPALASECNLTNGAAGSGTAVAGGGTCAIANFDPSVNDQKIGSALVTGGDTITLNVDTSGIVNGQVGLTAVKLNEMTRDVAPFDLLYPYTSGEKLSLNVGAKNTGVPTFDNITQNNVTVSTYNSGAFQTSDWGETMISKVLPVQSQQYINARFGTVTEGTLNVEIGNMSAGASPTESANTISMVIKQSDLVLADGASSTVNWNSRNTIVMSFNEPPSATKSTSFDVAQYAGTVVFNGTTYTVTNATELAAYNDVLVAALLDNSFPVDWQNGETPQQAYDAAFNAARLPPVTESLELDMTLPSGDDANQSPGNRYVVHVDNGASGRIAGDGQIDVINGSGVLVSNDGTFEIDAGGRLSSVNGTASSATALTIASGGSATNNGVIAGGYAMGDGLNTVTAAADNFGAAPAVNVADAGSSFTNNGIVNVGGNNIINIESNTNIAVNNYGVAVTNGASAENSSTGIINVGVNNSGAASLSGAVVGANSADTASSFENDGLIYIGRGAQYATSDAPADITNGIVKYGIRVTAGEATNTGEIVIGSGARNTTAMALSAGAAAGSSIANDGDITINGGNGANNTENIGMAATNTTGTVTNTGTITLAGTYATAIKVTGNTVATAATHSGTIDVTGGLSGGGLRNYGIYVDGQNATATLTTGGDGDGVVNLTGNGAIGVHARNGGTININSGSPGVKFISGTNQIGFFLFGAGSTINNNSGVPLDVSTEGSTLFRVENGATYTGAGETMTASGIGSTLITGSGVGAVVTTDAITFDLTGAGATAVRIDGGATGTIAANATINLAGEGAVAGLVDGRKVNLNPTTAPSGSFASTLTNNAEIESSTDYGVGFITQYGGTLNNNGVIDLDGNINFGIIARSGGILNNSADVTVANGVGLLVDGAGSASQLSNTATITANDGIAAIEVINGATLNGDQSTGNIVAGGTAHGLLIAAAGPSPQDPLGPNLAAGAGASLGANTITINGTGSGVENAAETSNINFTNTVINVKDGAGIRTATSISTAAIAEVNVTGAGIGFKFQQADGNPATGNLDLGAGYTINVDGSSGTHGGVGILADTTGTAATAATVNVTDAQGGAALHVTDNVTAGSNSGTLTSVSTAAATVRADNTSFSNSGTISNTSSTLAAVEMGAADATMNNTGVVNGNILMNGNNATVNVGVPGDSGTVNGDIRLTGGTNNVLITGGSFVDRVLSSATGNDTVTIRGAGNSFNTLTGAAAGSDTLVFDAATYTFGGTTAITNYEQVNLINSSTVTLQKALDNGVLNGAGPGIDVATGSTLAVVPSPAGTFTLRNLLTGTGLITVNTGAGNAFNFASTSGTFDGTVALGPSTFLLEGVNTAALADATLRLDTDSVTTVGAGEQEIFGLRFNGGRIIFDTAVPDAITAANSVKVDVLSFTAAGGEVGVTLVDPYDVPAIDTVGHLNLLSQDNGDILMKLVTAGTVDTSAGNAAALIAVDQNGNDISNIDSVDIRQDGDTVAIGSYGFDFTDGNAHDGLYLSWGLTELDLQTTKTLTLTPDTGASGDDITLSAKVTGVGNLEIDAGTGKTVILSNSSNDYSGDTTVSSGTLELGASNVLGQPGAGPHTALLTIANAAKVDLKGYSQTIDSFLGVLGSELDFNAGELTIKNGGTSRGTLTGAGDLILDGGLFEVYGANAGLSAKTTIASGATAWLDNAAGLGSGDIEDNGTLEVANATAGTLVNSVSGTGQFIKSAGGVLTLLPSGANTYSGPTSVKAGTLLAGAEDVFSADSDHTVDAGARLDSAGLKQTVASLVNSGVVNIANPGGPTATFTVTNDYEGKGGTIILGTEWKDDNSDHDTFAIGGDATGSTFLQVLHRGADTGAATIKGIQLVSVGGTSEDTAFTLSSLSDGYFPNAAGGSIAAGAYDYTLQKGAGDGTDTESWYLFSKPGIYRPEVGAYLDNRSVAMQSQWHTLHDRQTQAPGMVGAAGKPDANSWVRVEGRFGRYNSGRFKSDDDRYLLHLGSDLMRWNVDEGSLRLGAMALITHSSGTTKGVERKAKQSVEGVSGGLYATWYGAADPTTGPYVDAWLLGGSFKNTVNGDVLAKESYRAHSWAASLEAGYGITVHESRNAAGSTRVVVQPQAQIISANYRSDKHREENGTLVSHMNDSQLTTRLGVRMYADMLDGTSRLRPYAELNWWHGPDSQSIHFDTTRVSDKLPANMGELKLGLESNVTSNLTLWGGVGAQRGSGFHSHTVNVGLKYAW
ncbi:MAG: autotransporter outer membrane beta-barrel domain-containing protein [Zoogloeaceae bacterium]|nr:autotransporter outer membrane beta-barrel domain-containing protein [Zoogloeaceae bacterium]